MKNQLKYYAVNKPYGMLSQFTDKDGRLTLSSLFAFPKNVYPIGRLDLDSEGLLLLSNDKLLVDLLLNPAHHYEKEYFVQVEGIPTSEAIEKLRTGVVIQGYKTLPAKVNLIEEPNFPERIPPIRFRKNIPTSWMSIILNEGKNRQVRRMTASVGFPTLRLIRVRINNIHLESLGNSSVRELTKIEVDRLRMQKK